MHLPESLGRVVESSHASGCGHTGTRQGPASAHHPLLAPIGIALYMWHAVAHPRRRTAGPEVCRFRHMGVGVNDGVSAHGITPSDFRLLFRLAYQVFVWIVERRRPFLTLITGHFPPPHISRNSHFKKMI
jgi:hypothetical protein